MQYFYEIQMKANLRTNLASRGKTRSRIKTQSKAQTSWKNNKRCEMFKV